ncbi:TetR/AcrR family transcriptional regulator [Modestobacter versicolor]|uniref:AcrR family transcriptional regulator n=1 Tax=Modestobacter versicolor TaxID=429133 RepID=A0A323VDK9_9ACTN|nr:TetR/AcrR family transcriptional regulator [Modestobacter versicolor]MBB3675818.1 AcrR family transcriptional regulator [Modestobacter versicolor]PZA22290.1 TetR family transcriptional regulator [Modestobacter versicolor]
MTSHGTPTPGLWSRTRRAVHDEVVGTALDLFTNQGFEATTVDQIVAATGLSRTSFFRYFGSKEDLVLGDTTQTRLDFSAALRARPQEEGPWEALRAAALTLPGADLAPDRALTVAKLIRTSPALRARSLEKHQQWQDSLVPVLQERLAGEPNAAASSDLAARAVVAAALSCLQTATEVWAERDGRGTLGELYDQAIAAVRR